MYKRILVLIGLVSAVVSSAAAQQPQGAVASDIRNRWVVSVVHRVDLNKLINRIRTQQKARVGVPGSAPETIFNVATGLAVDSQGHVVTRLAYLDPEDKDQRIWIVTSDGRTLPARLIGLDCATGFSVLQVESLEPNLPEFVGNKGVADGLKVKILSADYMPAPGTRVKGNELFISPSIKVTQGQVATDSMYSKARGALTLRSTGLLSRNDSSIVTTDTNQVIGMAQYAGYGRAYLFPVDFIRDTVAKRVLERNGSVPAGWLGVFGDSIARIPDTESGAIGLEKKAGVIVRDFPPNSPAFNSGVLANDVIIGIDGLEIAGSADLGAILSLMPAGHKARLRLVRNREVMEVNVELGPKAFTPPVIDLGNLGAQQGSSHMDELKARLTELAAQHRSYSARKDISPREIAEARRELEIEIRQIQDSIRVLQEQSAERAPGLAQRDLDITADNVDPTAGPGPDIAFKQGFVARELTQQLASFFGAKSGLLIVSVAKDSAADRAGLKTGDVITGAGDNQAATISDFRQLFSTQKGEITLRVVRDKTPLSITIGN